MIVDPETAARVVAERFGWARPRSMVLAGQGSMGRLWRLETEAGPYAVKELYWSSDLEAEEAAVARQVRFCETARAAGVAAPANLATSSGGYVIALPAELGGRLIRAYEWIDGRLLTPDDAAGPAWAGRTEAIIESLAVLPGDQELEPWFHRVPTPEDWAELVDRCAVAGQPWVGRLRESLPFFADLAGWVRTHDPADRILTHTDFQRQNVLVRPDGRFVLLDWDDAGPSSRVRSLARLINNWHIHGTTVDHDGIRRMITGYRDAGGTAMIGEVTDFGDAICGYLNHVHSQAGLSLDYTQPAELTSAAVRLVPRLLEAPPHLGSFEAAIRTATTA